MSAGAGAGVSIPVSPRELSIILDTPVEAAIPVARVMPIAEFPAVISPESILRGGTGDFSARRAPTQPHRGQIAGFKPPTDNTTGAPPHDGNKERPASNNDGRPERHHRSGRPSSRPPDGCRRPSIRHPSSFFLSSLPVRPAQAPDRGRQSNHPHPQCPQTDAPSSPEPQASSRTPRRGSWPPAARSGIPRRRAIRRA